MAEREVRDLRSIAYIKRCLLFSEIGMYQKKGWQGSRKEGVKGVDGVCMCVCMWCRE